MTATWTETERQAWAPREQLSCSEWVERHGEIPAGNSRFAGKVDLALTPYMAGVLDALGDLDHTEVVFCAGTQISKSETGRQGLGYWIDGIAGPPGDVLIVYPTEESAKETIEMRVIPMLRGSGRLRRWMTARSHDVKRSSITLTARRVFAGWSGSPQATASRPCRFVQLEEEDKFPPWRGREASASALADDRTMTFEGYAKKYRVSTPTIPEGPIWQAWTACTDRRRWHVPCPRCGALQHLVWDRFRWDGQDVEEVDRFGAIAEELLAGTRAVRYLCSSCNEPIEEAQKRDVVARGRWVSDGCAPGVHPRSTRVGFHLWAAYSPFVSWRKLIAEFLKARAAGLGELQNFYNAYLALPFTVTRGVLEEETILRKAARHRGGVVPPWARGLVAGADGGRRGPSTHWWWVVRAWGARGRSRLVAKGRAASIHELVDATLGTRWPVEDIDAFARPLGLLIDAGGGDQQEGSMTQLALDAAERDPRITAVRGRGGPRTGRDPRAEAAKTGKAAAEGRPPLMLDVAYYKDLVAGWIGTPNADEPEELWEESDAADREYAKHMAAEHKVVEKGKTVWKKKTEAAPNHWWDCSIYAAAARDHLGLDDEECPGPTMAEEFAAAQRARADAAGQERPTQDGDLFEGVPWEG